jgi:hypothetical protein
VGRAVLPGQRVDLGAHPAGDLVLYYTYTGALGVHSLAADLTVFALAVIAGQAAALRAGTRGPRTRRGEAAGWAATALVAGLAVAWTWWPPHLPLFRDGRDGTYGIACASSEARGIQMPLVCGTRPAPRGGRGERVGVARARGQPRGRAAPPARRRRAVPVEP